MTISIIGTNGLLANEVGLFCNINQMDLISYGRREPCIHTFQEFNKVDLITEKVDISKLAKSEVIIYTCGAGIQSNLNESIDKIYNLNTYIPINICNELDNIGYEGTFVTFGTCFEIGNNSRSVEFTETDVVNSMLDVPNDYCVSKRLLSKFVASKEHKFKHIHLLLPTIYGEKEAKHRLIPYTVSSIKNNLKMQFTKGNQIRQYLYAGDVPKIIFELIYIRKEGIINLPGLEIFSVRNIVEEIYKFYGINTNEKLFGKAERADVGMQNLQLDGTMVKLLLPNFKYEKFTEILKLYDKCY